jgi:BirA family transcriptional regulator, biotin operon repressor / biotin---[acetyl-CoA-carboxylase] ligase
VRVALPDGEELTGTATGVDDDGALIVGERRVAAGDVVHVRAA